MVVERLNPATNLVKNPENIEIYSFTEDSGGLRIVLRDMNSGRKTSLDFESYEFFSNVANELTYCNRWTTDQMPETGKVIYWVEHSDQVRWLRKTSGEALTLEDEFKGKLKHLLILTIEKCCEIVFYGEPSVSVLSV